MPPLTIVLARSAAQDAAFEAYLAEQQDPASHEYHHWLTPDEVGQRFGLSTGAIASVTGWLQSQNLHVDWVSPSRLFIGFSGSAGDIGHAFQTEIHNYRLDAVHRFAVSSEPKIPSLLATTITAIRGLSQTDERPLGRFRLLDSASPEFTNGSNHFITPDDFAAIYDIGPALAATGQTIGIVGQSRTYSNDFNQYQEAVGTLVLPPTEVVPTAYGGVDPGPALTAPPSGNVSMDDQLEATLDVIRAGSTAPGAQILLVVATPDSGGIGDDAQYLVQTSPVPAQIMSISFGECESSAGASGVSYWDTLFKQAAAEGISVFVSSGDAGASGCDTNFATPPASPEPNSPNVICSSSYATCVGGTEFNDAADPLKYWSATNGANLGSASGYIPEGGWNEPLNDSSEEQAASSGGGVSAFIATPSWQAGTGVPSSRAGRYTPDISFSASEHDGYFGCFAAGGGSCSTTADGLPFVSFFGTSAAAPAMAGIAAILDYETGASQGNINPEVYKLSTSTPGVFHDATASTSGVSACSVNKPSMCNNSIPAPAALSGGRAGYMLTTGYDEVTGLGSLDVEAFIDGFSGPKGTPTISITTTASITTAEDELVGVVVNGRGALVPTGTVVVTCGTYTSTPITLSNGQQVLDVPAGSLPVGSNMLTVTYTPDTAGAAHFNASTAATPVTVTQAPIITPTIYFDEEDAVVNTAQTFEVRVSVYGPAGDTNATGSIYLTSGSYTSPKSGLAGDEGRLTVPGLVLPAGTDTLTVHYVPDAVGAKTYSAASQSNTIAVTQSPLLTPTAAAAFPAAGITTAEALPLNVVVAYNAYDGVYYVPPTGTVTVSAGTFTSPATSLSNGSANITIPAGAMPVGNDTITYSYMPDAVSAVVYTSAVSTQQIPVTAPPAVPPSFAVAGTAISVAPGATTGNTSTITVTPAGGFTGSVSLTASITASPAGAKQSPTLSFGTSSPVTISAAAGGTAILAVSTTPATKSSLKDRQSLASRMLTTGGGVLACMLLLCFRTRRGGWPAITGILLLWVVLAGGLLACGGGGSGSAIPPPITTDPGTTAGAYTITVTATSGSETQSTSIALNVQ